MDVQALCVCAGGHVDGDCAPYFEADGRAVGRGRGPQHLAGTTNSHFPFWPSVADVLSGCRLRTCSGAVGIAGEARLRITLFTCLLTVSFINPGLGQRFSRLDGTTLLQICTSSEASRIESCTAYVSGLADSVAVYQKLRPSSGPATARLPNYICINADVTGVQLREIVVRWLLSHSDRGSSQATGLVLNALFAEYPCGSGQHGGSGSAASVLPGANEPAVYWKY